MHPFSSRAFQRHQEHDLKCPNSMDLITTKQSKLPSFIDRYWSNSNMVSKFILVMINFVIELFNLLTSNWKNVSCEKINLKNVNWLCSFTHAF
jgi:hypothetical protein